MFGLLAGSPKGSCLLIDDNLHNDTTHSDAARHKESGSSPCHPSPVGQIVILQHTGNKDSKSQKVSGTKMPVITPALLPPRRRTKGLVHSLACFPRKPHADAQHSYGTHILEYQSQTQLIEQWLMDKMESDTKLVELPSRNNFLKQICFLMRPDFIQGQSSAHRIWPPDVKRKNFELK